MINYLRNIPKTIIVFIITVLSLSLHLYASKILNASYELSKFPVPYFEAQLSFSSEKIKDWYVYLIEEKTLDIYINTQHIDFLFIISVLMLHFFVLLLISRLHKQDSISRKVLIICALLSTIAPLSDALENLVSYIMLSNPTSFSNSLAIVYSSFATIKFAMFTFAYIAAVLGILIGLFKLIKNPSQQTI